MLQHWEPNVQEHVFSELQDMLKNACAWSEYVKEKTVTCMYNEHYFKCQLYETMYIDTVKPMWDNAKFLVKWNKERINRWKTPIIIPEPPL